MLNFKQKVEIHEENFFETNPVIIDDVQRVKINGKYIYEKFYLIDFFNIKDTSYVISSFGRIFSLLTNCELKPYTYESNDYTVISLRGNDGKKHKFPLHSLVARAFVPKNSDDERLNRSFTHHKDWDNENNYYWNLEWRSPYEIIILTKLQEDLDNDTLVDIVCKLLEKKESVDDVFAILDGKMSKHKIWAIKRRIIYKSISENYNF